MIAVGPSAGGFASVALTADPPPGLAAVISFAGGRGSRADDDVVRRGRAGRRLRCASAGHRECRCCGSMRRMTSSSGPNWRSGCTPPSAAGGRAAIHRRTGVRQRRPLAVFSSRSVDLDPDGRRFPARAESRQPRAARSPATPALCPAPAAERKGPRQLRRLPRRGPHKAFAVSPKGAFAYRSATSNVGPGRGRAARRLRKICAGLRAVCDRR